MSKSEVKAREYFGVYQHIVDSTASGKAYPFWETEQQRIIAERWDEAYAKATKIHVIEKKAYDNLETQLRDAKEEVKRLRQCCKDFEFVLEGSKAIGGQSDKMLDRRENALMRALDWDNTKKAFQQMQSGE